MDNGDLPAGPIGSQIDGIGMNPTCNGLTKREHFAGLAMQGILSNPYLMEMLNNRCQSVDTSKLNKEVVRIAYLHADIAVEGQQSSTQEDNDRLEKATGCSMEGLDKLTVRGDS